MSEAWAELLGSHERSRDSGRQDVPTHAPRAAVLACSDARVPPSVVFDQPAGSLFVVRVAGNVATPSAIASLDYAVAELGVGLVVVLGHTGCGAVTAALAGDCDGFLAPITRQLCEMLSEHDTLDAANLARRNVERSLDTLAAPTRRSGMRSATARSRCEELSTISPTTASKRSNHPYPYPLTETRKRTSNR